MGKSYNTSRDRWDRFDSFDGENVVVVNVDEIFVSDSTIAKLLARDGQQIDKMRQDFESGRRIVRVVLRHRAGGGYNIEDGRHRVIAAKLACAGFIEAVIR